MVTYAAWKETQEASGLQTLDLEISSPIPAPHHWKSQYCFQRSHYENCWSFGGLVDSEVKAEPRLGRAGVDLQKAALQVVLLCKTSPLRLFVFCIA